MSAQLWATIGDTKRWLPHVHAEFELTDEGLIVNSRTIRFLLVGNEPITLTHAAISPNRKVWLLGRLIVEQDITQAAVDNGVTMSFGPQLFSCNPFKFDVVKLRADLEFS